MNYLLLMIVFCEIGFFLLVFLGLSMIYIFNLKELGLAFLGLTPLIYLILTVVTSVSLYQSATLTIIHFLSYIYIGMSVLFGKRIIKWADTRFQIHMMKQKAMPNKQNEAKFDNQVSNKVENGLLIYLVEFIILLVVSFFFNNIIRNFILAVITIRL